MPGADPRGREGSRGPRVGNGELLSLSSLDPGNATLPTHGNPYTGGEAGKGALIPTPAQTSEAAAERAWVDQLKKLASATGGLLVADFYRCRPITYQPGPAPAFVTPDDRLAALDALCARPVYLWWDSGKTLFFRKRDWFLQRDYEVPDRWMLPLIARLQQQNGIPTHGDVLQVLQLTPGQLSGLNSLGRGYPLGERFDAGLQESLALLATIPSLSRDAPIRTESQEPASPMVRPGAHVVRALTGTQRVLMDRFVAVQHYTVPSEALAGEFRILLYCKSPQPTTSSTGYLHRPVVVSWALYDFAARKGNAGTPDLFLPLAVPDDRRDRTRVELAP